MVDKQCIESTASIMNYSVTRENRRKSQKEGSRGQGTIRISSRILKKSIVCAAAAMFLLVLDLSLALGTDLQTSPSLHEQSSGILTHKQEQGESVGEPIRVKYRVLRGQKLAIDSQRIVLSDFENCDTESDQRHVIDKILYGHLFKSVMISSKLVFPENAEVSTCEAIFVAMVERDTKINRVQTQEYSESAILSKLNIAATAPNEKIYTHRTRMLYSYILFFALSWISIAIISKFRHRRKRAREQSVPAAS